MQTNMPPNSPLPSPDLPASHEGVVTPSETPQRTRRFLSRRLALSGVAGLMIGGTIWILTAGFPGWLPGQKTDPTRTDVIQPPGNTSTHLVASSLAFDKAGEIDFVGKVESMNGDATTFVLANDEKLTIHKIPLTQISELFAQLAVGQMIIVEALADVAGKKFVAEEYRTPDPGDIVAPKVNVIRFNAYTTSAVQNNTVNFQVGDKKFSAKLVGGVNGSKIDAEDFPGGAGAIQANQHVGLDVLYNGSDGAIVTIDKRFS